MSLSARRAWIEILTPARMLSRLLVALRKESVDRNIFADASKISKLVALRKESVDRNSTCRGCWILPPVALRKESVDRNTILASLGLTISRRSPQGERG